MTELTCCLSIKEMHMPNVCITVQQNEQNDSEERFPYNNLADLIKWQFLKGKKSISLSLCLLKPALISENLCNMHPVSMATCTLPLQPQEK